MSIWTVYIHNNVNQDLTNNDINSIDLVSVKGCWVIGSDITDELQTTKFIEKVGEVFLSVITFYIAVIWRLLLPNPTNFKYTLQLQINLEGVRPPCIIFFVVTVTSPCIHMIWDGRMCWEHSKALYRYRK